MGKHKTQFDRFCMSYMCELQKGLPVGDLFLFFSLICGIDTGLVVGFT